MGANSLIQWTDHTFNPWRGCHKISEGCKNCYAATFVQNRQGLQVWGQDAPRKVAADSTWKMPHRWQREAKNKPYQCTRCNHRSVDKPAYCLEMIDPDDGEALEALGLQHEPRVCGGEIILNARPRVFCASLADVFEGYSGPSARQLENARASLWALIEATPNLLWLLLTKRPENIRDMVPVGWRTPHFVNGVEMSSWPANVWPGFTAENQARFDERWDHARKLSAPVIFTSIEPQIGPVVLPTDYLARGQGVWPFIGGESGPGARPFDLAWAESLIAQCKSAGVPVFMKQAGSRPIYDCPPGEEGEPQERDDGSARFWTVGFIKDKKGGDPSEWPARLRVREIPTAAGPTV